MVNREIVVIGASAGGVKALSKIVEQLPNDVNAAIFIVLHISPHQRSKLPEILTRSGNLNAAHPRDGERIRRGQIYVAPPDRHLLLEPGLVRVTKGPKENRFRPAIDPLFRSAAYAYGPGVIGVVLTGALDDGTAGLWAIKELLAQSRFDLVLSDVNMPRMDGVALARHIVSTDPITPIFLMTAYDFDNRDEI